MKTLKHLFTALLLLCCMGMAKAHDFKEGGIYYNILSSTDKTVGVTCGGYKYDSYNNEYTGSVVIPESVTYNGTTYSVTSIGYDAFRGCTGLASITIPNSVTSIGEGAFYGCTGITSITIPNSVTSIGNYAFLDCTGLTSIVIGNSVISIGDYAFRDCTGLTSITIPNSVTSIGISAFDSCTGLTSITIPNSVTSIGNEAFNGCTGLTSITIPNSVTSIGDCAFQNCTGLKSVVIGNSVTSIGERAFSGCSGLTSITIPNSVTSIGENAFYDCIGLTSVVIPNSVTSIGNYAFYHCYRLTSVVIGNSVTSIGGEAFRNCSGLKTVINLSNLTFSKGSSGNGYVAYYADEVYNARDVSMVGDFIFGKPNDVNTLLYYLGNATELTLPTDYNGENYTIGADVFKGNTTITCVVIPNSVTSIGNYAFYNCTGLKEVHISDIAAWCNIDFGNYAANPLYYANNLYLNGELLTELVVPDGVETIKYHAFFYCTGLTSIVIPNSVTSIGSYAFENCTGLTSVVIGNSVTSIGERAFDYCTGLKTVINLSNLTFSKGSSGNGYIAYYADKVYNTPNGSIVDDFVFGKLDNVNTLLYYLGNATELTLPTDYNGENYTIGADVFKGNTTITSIEIPNSVTSIGTSAFEECTNIENLYISNSLESIGEKAFAGCKNIKEIKVGLERPIRGDANIFADAVYNNAVLYVPTGTKSRYEKREPWNLFFDIVEMDFTGIDEVLDEVKSESGKVQTIYDLTGRKLKGENGKLKGIYIIDGKKVLVK